jgi:CspA family cold shock protein
MDGTIKTINRDKGFGFIRDDDKEEYFFHRSALDGVQFDQLFEGQAVAFEVVDSTKGPRAGRVALRQG